MLNCGDPGTMVLIAVTTLGLAGKPHLNYLCIESHHQILWDLCDHKPGSAAMVVRPLFLETCQSPECPPSNGRQPSRKRKFDVKITIEIHSDLIGWGGLINKLPGTFSSVCNVYKRLHPTQPDIWFSPHIMSMLWMYLTGRTRVQGFR